MKGLKYQLKSVLKDKFCLMTFLLPIVVAVALNFMGSIDLSSLGEHHFGVLENDLSSETMVWLERYGSVTSYETMKKLTAAINESSTNIIGVKADGASIKTVIAGDELDIFRQAAVTLPALYEQRKDAEQAEGRRAPRPEPPPDCAWRNHGGRVSLHRQHRRRIAQGVFNRPFPSAGSGRTCGKNAERWGRWVSHLGQCAFIHHSDASHPAGGLLRPYGCDGDCRPQTPDFYQQEGE